MKLEHFEIIQTDFTDNEILLILICNYIGFKKNKKIIKIIIIGDNK